MDKYDYGTGIAQYFKEMFSKKLLGKANTEATKKAIKRTVQAQLDAISNGGIDESSVHCEQDSEDPTKMNITVKMNVPTRRMRDLVVMDPKKEETHSWKEHYKKGSAKCSRCGMSRVRMNSKEIDDSYADDFITLADYNYSCDEMSVKDIIE